MAIDPKIIEGLSMLNTGIFDMLVGLNETAKKKIDQGKTLGTLLGATPEKKTFDELQKAREEIFDYLTDLNAEAEKTLNQYKK